MPITVTSAASIRTPDEDASYATNCWYHWKCDESSGNILDYGPAGPTRNLASTTGSPTYAQSMAGVLNGILFDGNDAKYSSSADSNDLGHTTAVNDVTVELFIVNKGNPALSGTNVYMGDILNLCGSGGDGTVFPRQVRDKAGTTNFGGKWGWEYNLTYHSGPGGTWDNDGNLSLGTSTTDLFHIAFLYHKGAEGVGYTKMYIDGVDQGYSTTYGTNSTNDYHDTALESNASDKTKIILGGRVAGTVNINAIVAHVAVWDCLITNFAGAVAGQPMQKRQGGVDHMGHGMQKKNGLWRW